ncbi:MAG: RNA polymerase sigma factor [Planctomycetaceae bacterium]
MVEKNDDRRPIDNDRKLADVRLDAELMNALTASEGKDGVSLGTLMVRHRGLVLNELRRWHIRRCDVDDVANKVWDKVWTMGRDQKWNSQRAVHVADPFVPLLKRICRSKAMDFHRGMKRERKRQARIVEAFEAWGDDWRTNLEKPRRRVPRAELPRPNGVPAHLQGAVARLPDQLRRVFELHSTGMSNVTIATEVRCSKGEVSKRLNKAREALGMPTTRKSPGPDRASRGGPEVSSAGASADR